MLSTYLDNSRLALLIELRHYLIFAYDAFGKVNKDYNLTIIQDYNTQQHIAYITRWYCISNCFEKGFESVLQDLPWIVSMGHHSFTVDCQVLQKD